MTIQWINTCEALRRQFSVWLTSRISYIIAHIASIKITFNKFIIISLNYYNHYYKWASPMAQQVKNSPAMQDTGDVGSIQPLQHSCLKKSHEQRSLAGYSPWGCKESDTVEQLTLSLSNFITIYVKSKHKYTHTYTHKHIFLLRVLPFTFSCLT